MARYTALVSEAVLDAENTFSLLLDAVLSSGDEQGKSTFIPIRAASVEDMVRQLLTRLPEKDDIYQSIVIQGHGSPGNQSVGDGKKYDDSGSKNLSIRWTDDMMGPPNTLVGNSEAKLLPLVSRLSSDCIITLAGCNVGAGAAGRILMQIISRALQWRLVQASEALQTDVLPGMEGTVIRCNPVACWKLEKSSWIGVPGR